jgi:hypothetical protein
MVVYSFAASRDASKCYCEAKENVSPVGAHSEGLTNCARREL